MEIEENRRKKYRSRWPLFFSCKRRINIDTRPLTDYTRKSILNVNIKLNKELIRVLEKIFVLFVYQNNKFVLKKEKGMHKLIKISTIEDRDTIHVIDTTYDMLGSLKKPLLLPTTRFMKKLSSMKIFQLLFCASIFDYDEKTMKKNGLYFVDLDFVQNYPEKINDVAKIMIGEYLLEVQNDDYLKRFEILLKG